MWEDNCYHSHLQTDGRLSRVHGSVLVPSFPRRYVFCVLEDRLHYASCCMHLKMLEMLGPKVCMTVVLGVNLPLGPWFIFFCITSEERVFFFFPPPGKCTVICTARLAVCYVLTVFMFRTAKCWRWRPSVSRTWSSSNWSVRADRMRRRRRTHNNSFARLQTTRGAPLIARQVICFVLEKI